MIKITIDELGQITSQIDQVRQGDKGVVVQATFEDKDNINYVAKINLTRNDGEMASGLIMQPDAEHSDTFVRTLESEWYFCKKGQTSLTVYLYKSGVVDAQGQVEFNVEETDYDGEPTITPDQYDELVELIATKLGIKDSIVVANTISALGNLLDYNVGQVFYIRNDGKIYQLNSSYNLDIVIDLYLVDFTILDEVEVSETKTANKITKSIALKNTHGQTFYDFDIEFNVATTSDAGLMSASDKVKLNALPTADQIEQQHTNLHNEVVAEKTRAEDVEAQKENLSNKKTVINDSTANNTNYASVKAVKDFVNDAINNVSAYYITKNATGDAFESVEELEDATTFYSGGEVRTPTRNDYCIVRTDENHDNATTRYIYQGSQWEFQYIVNEEPFTDAQLQAINSGATATFVLNMNQHRVNTDIHIRVGDKAKIDQIANKQIKNKTFDHIPQANELEEGQVGIVPSVEERKMPEVIIGDGLEVITDAQSGQETLQISNHLYKHFIYITLTGTGRCAFYLEVYNTRESAPTTHEELHEMLRGGKYIATGFFGVDLEEFYPIKRVEPYYATYGNIRTYRVYYGTPENKEAVFEKESNFFTDTVVKVF